eukprot:3116012-Rhodomonas_salina.2
MSGTELANGPAFRLRARKAMPGTELAYGCKVRYQPMCACGTDLGYYGTSAGWLCGWPSQPSSALGTTPTLRALLSAYARATPSPVPTQLLGTDVAYWYSCYLHTR